MTKRILSMLLALSMALSVCPVSAFAGTGGGMLSNPAAPQTVDEQNDLLSKEHQVSNDEDFKREVDAINNDTSSDTLHDIFLSNSIHVTDEVTFKAGHTVKIIGKGKTITFSGNGALKVSGAELALSNVFLDGQSQTRRAPGVTVESSGTLKMEENSCIQNFTNSAGSGSGGGVYVGSGSTMTMNGGTIKDCSASDGDGGGGGIYAAGAVVLNGGTISGCKAVGSYKAGGGIYIDSSGSLTMGGGSIESCTASNWGGGVFAQGTFELTGGSITNCSALSGGGVNISNATTTLNGGTIKDCTATTRGGGVYIAGIRSTLKMTNGSITGCTAAEGGGVYINNCGSMNMTGGSITGCGGTGGTSGSDIDIKGGGVYVYSGSMKMTDGSITKCSASSGGGIYINSDSAFTDGGSMNMTGGSITDCSAGNGGGIYNDQILTFTSGAVCNNTAATQGADIYLGSSMSNTTLLDAAAMGQTYGTTGSKIDGWYKDASGARYTPDHNGTPVDVVNALTQDMALVASYRKPSAITVNGGTASVGGTTVTEAKKGETVTIKADPDTEDVHFAGWDSKSQGVSFDANKGDRNTTFVMPGNDVEISTIKAYHVAVTDGTASPDYAIENKDVVLTYTGAYDFVNWQVDSQDINGGTFAMRGHAVKVTPVVKAIDIIPQYTLTVNPPEGIAADAVTVTVGGNQVKSAAADATVSIAFNASALPADGSKTFGEWVVADADGKPVTVTDGIFTMPASNVVVTFTLKDAGQPDTSDMPSDGGSGAGAVIAGAVIGTATYLVGTHAWLHHLYGFIPQNRIQLALALWKRADCPQPESTALYPDIDEDDDDAQAAARWCVEQGLMKDYHKTDKDGNEEVTFKPYRYVFRPQAIKAWYDLEKLLNEQPQNGT